MSRGDSSKALRRRKCPDNCICLCHDTNGGVQDEHKDGKGPCPGKVPCPLCGQQHGKPCAGKTDGSYHEQRREAAAEWTRTNERTSA